jgi:hypothetical protein
MQSQDQSQKIVSVPTPTVTRSITVVGSDGKTQTLAIPGSEADMRALVARKEALSDQLASIGDRRHNLSMELQGTADPVARSGLEARVAVLDKQILQLENDLAVTANQLAGAPSNLIGITEDARNEPQGDHFPEGVVVGGFSAFAIASILFALTRRRRWGRPSTSGRALQDSESAQRLGRLEQGMDAIAVEIERISEGQRFVTKLLSEQQPLGTPRRVAPAQSIGEER